MTDRETVTAVLDLAAVEWQAVRSPGALVEITNARFEYRFAFDPAGRMLDAWYRAREGRTWVIVESDPRYYKSAAGEPLTAAGDDDDEDPPPP